MSLEQQQLSYSRSAEIMQSIPLIRPIIAYACSGIKTPIILSSVCQTFREAVVDYAGAEVAWRSLMKSSKSKNDKSNGLAAVSGFMYHAAKHNFPSWIINSLARAGVVYDEDLLRKLFVSTAKIEAKKKAKEERKLEGNNNRRSSSSAGSHSSSPSTSSASDKEEDDDGEEEEEVDTNNDDSHNHHDGKSFGGLGLRIDYAEERDDAKNYFHYLAHFGRVDCVQTMLEFNSADPRKKTNAGKTSLMFAVLAKENSAEITRLLLEAISDEEVRKDFVEIQDVYGKNALMWAVKRKNALMWAVKRKNYEAVELLLKLGKANVEVKSQIDDDRPLHLAASSGDLKIVKALIKIGNADVEAKGTIHSTPLLQAIALERFDVAKFLIEECAADVNAVDGTQYVGALHRAVKNCDVPTVKLLMEHKVKVVLKDPETTTAKGVFERILEKEVFAFTQKQKESKEEIKKLLEEYLQ